MVSPRENNFDAVRLIAAAAVICGHAYPLTGAPEVRFMGNSVQYFAVKVFFVISGFLVATSWLADPNVGRYLEKRALRIFPALVVVVGLSALVLGPMVSTLPWRAYFGNQRLLAYFSNVLLQPSYDLPGVFAGLPYPVAVNGSLWSLPIEFAMYLLLPVLCALSLLLRSRFTFLVATAASCGCALLGRWLFPPAAQPVVFYGTSLPAALAIAPYFLLGACYRVLNLERALSPVAALGMVGMVVLFQPQGATFSELTLYLVAPYAILSFAVFPHDLFSRVGRWGDFSYGLYLYGFPVQQATNFLFHRPLSPLQNMMISLPISLVLAVLSWHLIEKRALTLKPRRPESAISAKAQELAT